METPQETLLMLSGWFLQTLSPDRVPRREAEQRLSDFADKPGFSIAILHLLASPADDQIRLAASVHFKNHLRSRWSPPEDLPAIPDQEKNKIKELIVPLMLNSPPLIRSQLSECLAVIGKHDFPKLWPQLLPDLVSSLAAAAAPENYNYAVVNGVLTTANSLFKKFRFEYKTNVLFLDLKYCLDKFAAPLLELFLRTGRLIEAQVGANSPPEVLVPLFECQRLCCRIFFSLNFQELPEFFEDHMKEWMDEFLRYLTAGFPSLENVKAGLEVVDSLRSAICENINLYMEKNEEEFHGYVRDFAFAVFNLLVNVSLSSSRDHLAIMAIKFLTTISTSVEHSLFAAPESLSIICQKIVIPNVRARDEDEELFEMNYVEYIRRDIEGSDVDTRRRIACELLKGLVKNYREQVKVLVSQEIQNMLAAYLANPTVNWKEKDCAVYLVISLASSDLVDVGSFFDNVIVPELRSGDVNSQQILKADALKFFTTFRSQISKPTAVLLVPDLIRFLSSESNVVHSYATNCIEKLLLVNDDGRRRYTSGDIAPFLGPLMTNLFNVFRFPESEENQYAMKCIMRVFGVAEFNAEVSAACIAGLCSILNEVCKNPKNPIFNHYLFESVAALVRRGCERDLSMISVFEAGLFPILQQIMVNDITEFLPYALQIFAQMVEINRPPLSAIYLQLFDPLLSPQLWAKHANVPALVRLLQAYLQKAPHELNREGRLTKVLEIFQNLVNSARTEEHGFYIVNTVIETVSYDVISPYVPHIWNALFTRLKMHRTVKFMKSFVILMCLFLVKHGHLNLVNSINAVQANIFNDIVERFWVPNLRLITGTIEVKLSLVASTMLLCESPAVVPDWGKMLDSIITLVSIPEQKRVEDEPDVPDIEETVGYSASFVSLYNAGRKDEDLVKEIRDPKEFLVVSLSRLSQSSPGKYPEIIKVSVDAAKQQALRELCMAYNQQII